LLVGVPGLILVLARSTVLPTSWPNRNLLSGTLSINQVLTVLVVVVLLVWLQFAVCVAVEVVAALRGGVLAAPVPLSGPSQRLARALVASMLVAGTMVGQMGGAQAAVRSAPLSDWSAGHTAVAAAAPFAAAASGPTLLARTGGNAAGGTSPGHAHDAAALEPRALRSLAEHERYELALDGRKVYVVKAPAGRDHDSLWEIAERHLGDGRRYQEIYRLNEGRPQPDGRSLHLARLIQPGWLLVMPEDAVGVARYVADRPAPAPTHTPAHTSASGPVNEMSPPTQAPVPAHARRPSSAQPSSAQPSSSQASSTQASLARAAQQPRAVPAPNAVAPTHTAPPTHPAGPTHTVPATHQTAPPTHTAAPTHAALPTHAAPPSPAAPPTHAAAPTHAPPPTHAGPPAAAPAHTAPAQTAPAQTAPARAQAEPHGSDVPWSAPTLTAPTAAQGVELIGAGLLAAALLGTLLGIRRRRGNHAVADPETAETEVWMRTGADADRGALLDLALRSLSRSCRDAGRPLPQAYGAVVDNDGLDLLVTMAHQSAPPPWRPTAEGLRWRLTYDDAQHLVADGDSAYPLLASVGRDAQGRDALVNLGAAAGPVAVVGSPAMAAAVVRALALGLAGNPWSRGIEVLTADLPPALPAIAAGRLTPCAGARDLTDQLEQGSGRLPRTGPIQILTGGPAPGSRPERVAVYGAPLNAPTAARLQALVGRRSDLAVLVAGELPGARWRLKVDDAGNLSCSELSLEVTANRLGDGSIERLHSLFLSATTSGQHPGVQPERSPESAPLVEVDDVTWAQAPVRVAILGEVEVRTPETIDPGRLALAAEIVAYLALHPAGVHPTVLASAIWPRGVTTDVQDATFEQVRDWLGTDTNGAPRLREGHDGRLRLVADVPCDWGVLRTLVTRAGQAPDPSRERDLLVRALHLVRGPVVGGITHGTYTWLPRTDLERQAEELIIDAADRLSQICLEEGDQVAVEQAAAAGLRAVPAAQHLWRHVLRAEHALGGPVRLARATEHLRFVLATSGVVMEPETQALIEHLASVPTSSGPGS
jgi:hypothetical protein